MSRPKEFDRSEALAKAMDVFWERGYAPVTMTELRENLGIGRQSLYDTFGTKNQLFSEALEAYVSAQDREVAEMLAHTDPLEGIRCVLDSRVSMLTAGPPRGCLLVNTCAESPHDTGVASQVAGGFDQMRRGFELALDRAKASGQIAAGSSSTDLAAFLVSQVAGLVVMSKSGATPQELSAIAAQALRALR